MKSVIFLCGISILLGGCSSSDGLECPMGIGLPCHSLGQVSDHIDAENARHDPTQVYVVLERI